MNDTIAAIATPIGSGGIGIIRISGEHAFEIASRLFSTGKLKGKKTSAEHQPSVSCSFDSHRVCHGYILDQVSKDIIDEVLLIPMKGPRSYTAEDVIEIQAHAGNVVLSSILDQILACGARLADPGEFTRRAFLNNRIDLTQAEAVADIINAKSVNALKCAAFQNLGTFKNQINDFMETLTDLLSNIEANIDFPEDTHLFTPSEKEINAIAHMIEKCRKYIQRYEDASFLKEGIKIVIAGAPNVGKSSLMNRLLDQERSIVTHIPGTTRDPIEQGMNINGVPFVIADTAGIHQTDDLVEIIGMEKAKDHITDADIVLFLKEPGTRFSNREFEKIVPVKLQKNIKVIFVINKIDVEGKETPQLSEKYQHLPVVEISALENIGVKTLKQKVLDICMADLHLEKSSIIPNLRHKKALEETVENLERVKEGFENAMADEMLAIDINNSMAGLGSITGQTASIDILDRIFNNFCIGK